MTNEGLIHARDLPPTPIGDQAPASADSTTGAGLPSPQPPIAYGCLTKGAGVCVETEVGDRLTVAVGQPVLVVGENLDLAWRPAGQLRVGDLVVLDNGRTRQAWSQLPLVKLHRLPPRIKFVGTEPVPPLYLDEEMAKWIGLFAGNGSQTHGIVSISVFDGNPDLVAWLANTQSRMGMKTRFNYIHHSISVIAGCKRFVVWLVFNDIHKLARPGTDAGSASAHIPLAILRSPVRVVTSYLAAYFSTDGSASVRKSGTVTVSATSVSPTLTSGHAILLRHLGIRPRVRTYLPSRLARLPIHELRIADAHNASLFGQRVGFMSERKQQNMRKARVPDVKSATHFHSVAHPALFDDLLSAPGLDPAVRTDIRSRRKRGFCNQEWLWRLIRDNPPLQATMAAKLGIPDIDYAAVTAIAPVPGQDWVQLATPTGEPVFGNAFTLATSQST
jgi:hypothetical protein